MKPQRCPFLFQQRTGHPRSGVKSNVVASHELVARDDVRKVVVTHSPKNDIDMHVIMGINHKEYNPSADHVLSSSICDANAIAHPLKALNDAVGVIGGSVTTLHPWLNYQNLLDAPVASQRDPGHVWKDYSLGRTSVGSLIPKNTTAVEALKPVLGDLAERIGSFSYRTPNTVVASADLTLLLDRNLSQAELEDILNSAFDGSPFVALNWQSLISLDYQGQPWSAVIDMQWVKAIGGGLVKIVAWYDNEWGYASRALDVAVHSVSANDFEFNR
ncbi:hypothetical protein [Nitratireductor sp. XY-223]|uniref:hypothetical protein n=1 Tax=Nitratireductor sp. XY-223 TaxID=2561926 RepID=UPI0010AAE950|nr:hypothetical protein [Nitratireductor sp. XY-223]